MLVAIVDNYKELKKHLIKMNSYKMNNRCLEIVNEEDFDGRLTFDEEYDKSYENKLWCIYETETKIWVEPYEKYCKNYLNINKNKFNVINYLINFNLCLIAVTLIIMYIKKI